MRWVIAHWLVDKCWYQRATYLREERMEIAREIRMALHAIGLTLRLRSRCVYGFFASHATVHLRSPVEIQGMDTIPILHCFDHNYVLQAGVCFHSLLSHTSPTRHYVLHVMATGLTAEDKDLLQGIVGHFRNATLVFDNPPKLDLPDLKGGNFSKALFYKLALANLYPQYDRAIVSDVDVVYADDIALAYDVLPVDSSAYLAGPLDVTYASWRGEGILRDLGAPKSLRRYFSNFSAEERSQLRVGAGFMTFNLRRMREEQIPDRCFSFAKRTSNVSFCQSKMS